MASFLSPDGSTLGQILIFGDDFLVLKKDGSGMFVFDLATRRTLSCMSQARIKLISRRFEESDCFPQFIYSIFINAPRHLFEQSPGRQ